MERRGSAGASSHTHRGIFAPRHASGSEVDHVLPNPGSTNKGWKTNRRRQGHRCFGLHFRRDDLSEKAKYDTNEGESRGWFTSVGNRNPMPRKTKPVRKRSKSS